MALTNTAPKLMRAGTAHRRLLYAFRLAARPFAGTPLGTSIARRVPFARGAYYGVYSRISQSLLDVRTPSGMLTVDLRDRSVAQKLYLGRKYEPAECALFAKLVEPGMTFFDVGAHVGYYTLLAARLVGDAGRVVSFEPDARNFELLAENVRRNALTNVEVANMAVAAREGELQLYRDPDWAGDHRIHAVSGRESVAVRCTTLDGYAARHGAPDVIKMDVQGAEGEVLAGMRDILRESPPVAIVAEFWPAELTAVGCVPADFVETLRGAGYVAFNVPDDAEMMRVEDVQALVRSLPGEQDYTNLCFIRADTLPSWLP